MARSKGEPGPSRSRYSDRLLRGVLDNAAIATFLVSPDNRLLYVNRAFCELLGYGAEESVGVGLDQIVDPAFAEQAREQLGTIFDGRLDHYSAERQYLRKNGEPVWVMVRANVMRNEKTGDTRYIVVQALDIDRQKRAEAALAENESLWNFALESAGQGVWDRRFNPDSMFYSRMWRVMRGIPEDEVLSPTLAAWLERIHPDDRPPVRAAIEAQNGGARGYRELEFRERHRDGHWIWILSRGKPVAWNADGTPARMVGTDTDITHLKLAERKAALEREEFKVTLEAIADGVISTDANGRITFMNPVAEQLTGWSTDEAKGLPVEDIFHVVDGVTGTPAANPVRACLANGRLLALDSETVLVKRNRDRCDIRTNAAPLRSPLGGIIGAVLVFQDVTDSRARQRELAHTAMHDSLTGLPNRASFELALAEAADQARHEAREHALCFVDLDRFKLVNDSAGHIAGDTLLKSIATTIKASCRPVDLAARIGGDEFALLLPDCSRAAALRVAQQVVDAIAGLSLTWSGEVYSVGASVGIAAITHECTVPDELMRRADAACYVAKARGRNCVAVYDGQTRGLDQIGRTA